RTETNHARGPGVPRLVLVVIQAEADDGWAQHLRLPSGDFLEHPQQRHGVLPASVVLDGGDEFPDTDLCRFGLDVGHLAISPHPASLCRVSLLLRLLSAGRL